jgi:hypothetical protein
MKATEKDDSAYTFQDVTKLILFLCNEQSLLTASKRETLPICKSIRLFKNESAKTMANEDDWPLLHTFPPYREAQKQSYCMFQQHFPRRYAVFAVFAGETILMSTWDLVAEDLAKPLIVVPWLVLRYQSWEGWNGNNTAVKRV